MEGHHRAELSYSFPPQPIWFFSYFPSIDTVGNQLGMGCPLHELNHKHSSRFHRPDQCYYCHLCTYTHTRTHAHTHAHMPPPNICFCIEGMHCRDNCYQARCYILLLHQFMAAFKLKVFFTTSANKFSLPK